MGMEAYQSEAVNAWLKFVNRNKSFPQEPEDVFFSRHIRNYSNKIASLETAERFSCESRYTESTGAHASHLYLKACDQAKIYERHFKSVVGLIDSY